MGLVGNWLFKTAAAIGNSLPATSAQLDMQRTDGALYPPRLTTAQRDALTAALGMVIVNTTTGQLEGYDGSSWRKLDQDFEAFQTLVPTGTTQVIDFATGRNWIIDLGSATGNVTLTLNNPRAGVVYLIGVIQGAAPRDLIYPAAVEWPDSTPPVISTTDDDKNLIQLLFVDPEYWGLFEVRPFG